MTVSRIRRTRSEVASILAEYRASGLSARDFSAQKSVAVSTLYQWIRQARSVAKTNGGASRVAKSSPERRKFVSVELHDEGGKRVYSCSLRVELGNGRWLEIPSGFDPDSLSELLLVLLERMSA